MGANSSRHCLENTSEPPHNTSQISTFSVFKRRFSWLNFWQWSTNWVTLPSERKLCKRKYCLYEQRYDALLELFASILRVNDVSIIICKVLEYIESYLYTAYCAVYIINDGATEMIRISRGSDQEMQSIAGLNSNCGILAICVQTRSVISHVNFADHEAYDANVDLPQSFPQQSLLCVPLLVDDRVYGAIEITRKLDDNTCMDWGEQESKLLSRLGPLLNPCIRKCIEYHDVLLSERTQKALLHLISSSDMEDTVLSLVDSVIAGASQITRAERLTLFMIDWELLELWSLCSSYTEENLRVSLKSIVGLAATTRQTINLEKPMEFEKFNASVDSRTGMELKSALYVPVGIYGCNGDTNTTGALGVLEILNKENGEHFSADDEYALEAFACEVAVILRRKNNEIEYIKLLADTRAEQVLARRAKSQMNLLECFTNYSSTMKSEVKERVRRTFAGSPGEVRQFEPGRNESKHDDEKADIASSSGAIRDSHLHFTPVDEIENSFRRSALRQLGSSKMSRPSVPGKLRPRTHPIPGWDYNIFNIGNSELPSLAYSIFMSMKLDQILRTEPNKIRNFVLLTKDQYHPNPYHNFQHAVSVLHAAYLILTTTSASEMLTSLDIAGCLIAALCHDVDHPGHTNSFEVMSGTHLAMLYSDDSVLERHHAFTTFRILSKNRQANILASLTATEYRSIRKVIITSIFGTNMAEHFRLCEAVEKRLESVTRREPNAAAPQRSRRMMHSYASCHNVYAAKKAAFGGLQKAGMPEFQADPQNSEKEKYSTEIINVVREALCCKGSQFSLNLQELQTLADNRSSLQCPQSKKMRGGLRQTESFSGRLQSFAPHRDPNKPEIFTKSMDDRLFLCKVILHAADLSGQVFPKTVALKWGNLVAREFANQALLEKAENIPISFVRLDDPLEMVEGQKFFAQKLVLPLWRSMHAMFPQLKVCIDHLMENIAHYDKEIERLRHAPDDVQEPLHRAFASDSKARKIVYDSCTSAPHSPQAQTAEPRVSLSRSTSAPPKPSSTVTDGFAIAGTSKYVPAQFNSFRVPIIERNNDNATTLNSMDASVRHDMQHIVLDSEAYFENACYRDTVNIRRRCYSWTSRSSQSSISETSVQEISERDIETL